MQRSSRSLLNMCCALRHCKRSPKYPLLLQKSFHVSPSTWQDAPRFESKTLDEYGEKLGEVVPQNDSDPLVLFKEVLHKTKDMDGHKAVHILDHNFHLQNVSHSNQLVANKDFSDLCKFVLRDIRNLTIQEIISSLKSLIRLKVPMDTVIIQSLMQMLRTNVNRTPLTAIPFLSVVLHNTEQTPLSKALIEAFRIVFKHRMHLDFELRNVIDMFHLLKYSYHIRDQHAIDTMCNTILGQTDCMRMVYAVKIHELMCTVDVNHQYTDSEKLLLQFLQTYISANRNLLLRDDVVSLLRGIVDRVSRQSEFYNMEMTEALIDAAKDLNVNFALGSIILDLLSKLNHSSVDMIRYLSARLLNQTDRVRVTNYTAVENFIRAAALANYPPPDWPIIQELLLVEDVLKQFPQTSLIRLALHLAVLDVYRPNILDLAFDTITSELEKDSEILLDLYRSVKVFCPTYGASLSVEMLHAGTVVHSYHKTLPLDKFLRRAYDRHHCVKSRMRTRLGHIIDHAIVIHKTPGAIHPRKGENNEDAYSGFVEDLSSPSDSHTILILNYPKYAFCRNNGKMTGMWQLKLRTVETSTGLPAIAFNSCAMSGCNVYEATMMIVDAVKAKIGTGSH